MPKSPPPRAISERGESNLRQRIQHEREARGWSYEALARAMTEAGCPISKAAVYAIENGTPKRRILVDELVALAEVFEEPATDGMLRPLPTVLSEQAQGLLDVMKKAQEDLVRGIDLVVGTSAVYLSLLEADDELSEFKRNQLEAMMAAPDGHSDYVKAHMASGEGGEQSSAGQALTRAFEALMTAAVEYAQEQTEMRRG